MNMIAILLGLTLGLYAGVGLQYFIASKRETFIFRVGLSALWLPLWVLVTGLLMIERVRSK